MHATVIIPVKRFGAAKRRLDPLLDVGRRGVLAEAMLRDVLAAVGGCELVEATLVVTGEERAAAIADSAGADVIEDPSDSGHPEAALIGIRRAGKHGARAVALLPGDCPLLDAGELDALLDHLAEPFVGIVPDRHGTGTNGLVLAPPDAIRPAFGEGSRERHVRLARAAGVPHAVQRVESLALDLDTPDDLAALRDVLAADAKRAPRTAAALALAGPLVPDRAGPGPAPTLGG